MQEFYVVSPEIARLSEAEVAEMRAELGGVKVRGRGAPRPIRNWAQCGLPFPVTQVCAVLRLCAAGSSGRFRMCAVAQHMRLQ